MSADSAVFNLSSSLSKPRLLRDAHSKCVEATTLR